MHDAFYHNILFASHLHVYMIIFYLIEVDKIKVAKQVYFCHKINNHRGISRISRLDKTYYCMKPYNIKGTARALYPVHVERAH